MLNIEINNQTRHRVDKENLARLAKFVLKKLKQKIDLSVALVSQEEMQTINKSYRGINSATDGLSFYYQEDIMGEILICPDYIRQEAKLLNVSPKSLYETVLIHALLHLSGYDHQQISQTKAMEQLERELSLSYTRTKNKR